MPQTLTFTITTDDDNEEWTVVSNGSTDLTVPIGKTVVLASASVGQVSINLPSAATPNKDRVILVKKTDSTSNRVLINPAGSETVDGDLFYYLTSQYQSVTLVSDGSNWNIV